MKYNFADDLQTTMGMFYFEEAPPMYLNFPDKFEKAPPTWGATIQYLIDNWRAPLLGTGFVFDSDSVLSQIHVIRYIKSIWGFYANIEVSMGEYFDEMDSGLEMWSGHMPMALGIEIIPPIFITDNESDLFAEFEKQREIIWRG